ncbi:hypothetical protein [Microseira sp. BLCC-F43]|uniref:hypothetical protein n=1 Tax=Microseira sp. BLCC-F43 TaxID=3153602 RepID=UPI0035B9B9D6
MGTAYRTTREIRVTTVLGVVVRAMSNGGYLLFKESSRLQPEECQKSKLKYEKRRLSVLRWSSLPSASATTGTYHSQAATGVQSRSIISAFQP